ncbi:hypothetical protein FS837_006055 [Tulasnella sp. UAMH 9824]|nr:hypothetical protein FS837_006055 [Tulasnella sp. UAMH 9824]
MVLSFLGSSNTAAGIIRVGSAVCAVFLLLIKKLRNHKKNWARWFFERDLSGVLVIVLLYAIEIIRRFLIKCVKENIKSVLDDSKVVWILAHVGFHISILGGTCVVFILEKGRFGLWMAELPLAMCILLEEALVTGPTLIGLLALIGCALALEYIRDWIMNILVMGCGLIFIALIALFLLALYGLGLYCLG